MGKLKWDESAEAEADRLAAEAREKGKYRPVAVAVISDGRGKYLILQSSMDINQWMFPQGGIEKDEGFLTALYREIEEETGLGRADLRLDGYLGWTDKDSETGRKNMRGFSRGKRYIAARLTLLAVKMVRLKTDEALDYRWLSPGRFAGALSTTREAKREVMQAFLEKARTRRR